MMPKVQVDRGAIKFILSGANIMCPGLTSPGARMDESLPADTIVAVFCEGKQHAIAVGVTKLSTDDMYIFIFYYYLFYFILFYNFNCKKDLYYYYYSK